MYRIIFNVGEESSSTMKAPRRRGGGGERRKSTGEPAPEGIIKPVFNNFRWKEGGEEGRRREFKPYSHNSVRWNPSRNTAPQEERGGEKKESCFLPPQDTGIARNLLSTLQPGRKSVGVASPCQVEGKREGEW